MSRGERKDRWDFCLPVMRIIHLKLQESVAEQSRQLDLHTLCEVWENFASWTYRSVSADVSWRCVQLVRQYYSRAWLHRLSELAPCSIFFFFFSFNVSDDFGWRFLLRQIQFYPDNKLSRKARPLPLLKAFCGYRSFTNRTHRLMS